MLTTIMKYAAIAALLVGMFWRMPGNLASYLDFVISASAVFGVVQAVNLRKYVWVAAFIAIACVFNPVRPIGFSFPVMMGLQITSAALFAVSLQLLKTSPKMTIASITDANPRTEAL